MIWLAATALAVTAVTVLSCAQVIRSLVRSQARERATLIDQLMHLAGRTWTAPPSEQPEELVWDDAPADPRFESDPANMPDY